MSRGCWELASVGSVTDRGDQQADVALVDDGVAEGDGDVVGQAGGEEWPTSGRLVAEDALDDA